MADQIVSVEWGVLEGRRPRPAGSNARLGAHGDTVHVPLARITTDDGVSGLGVCWAGHERASELLGQPLSVLFVDGKGVPDQWLAFDYPLWDLAGKITGRPVYALAAEAAGRPGNREERPPRPNSGGPDLDGNQTPRPALSFPSSPELGRGGLSDTCRVRCYDTSLYFDDLHLDSDEEAAVLIASEAADGYARGHRAFKLKVGRSGRWMPLDTGTRRDIAIIRAVRAAVGPDVPLLLDANNGWNLNLTKQALAATADCGIYWMEEAFHEDAVLYRDLHEWLHVEGLSVLIADGEGEASPSLLNWAKEGLVDVVQYDIFGHGFTRWLLLGKRLDEWNVRSAPHHYGGHVGNYVTCHLAPALRGFTFTEWDEVTTPGLDASGYVLEDGWVSVPDTPGFGLSLDEMAFQQAVANGGWRVSLNGARP